MHETLVIMGRILNAYNCIYLYNQAVQAGVKVKAAVGVLNIIYSIHSISELIK